MQNFRKCLAIAVIAGVAAGGAQAQDWTGWYAGVQVGASNFELDSGASGDGTNFGLHAGYRRQYPSGLVLGAEGEFNNTDLTLSDGNEVDGLCRLLKGTVGYSYGDTLPYVTAGVSKLRSSDLGDDYGLAVGAGFAYRVSPRFSVGVEGVYLDHSGVGPGNDDANGYSISLRTSYHF